MAPFDNRELSSLRSRLDERVVVVSDGTSFDPETVSARDPILDTTERRHVSELASALRDRVADIVLYDSPYELARRIHLHRADLVLPNWGGILSRNRFALVPSICESAGVRYVGGDAYTKIVCHDKQLAKALIAEAGLGVAKSQSVTRRISARDVRVEPPLVVKPNFQGGSVAITDESLTNDPVIAADLANELLELFHQPVLIEEFVPGRECSVCILGHEGGIARFEAGERYLPDDPDYFLTHVFGAELKKKRARATALRLITPELSAETVAGCNRLFELLGKVEILRIDGRLSGDKFTVIELTPDTHLGARAEYCGAFIQAGASYGEVLEAIVTNTQDAYRYRDAST